MKWKHVLYYLTGLIIGYYALDILDYIGKPKPVVQTKSTYCEANQIKEFYRKRTYQFHAGEINAQGYKDSLYKDLQTHFILNK